MRLLLDTHVLLWCLATPNELSADTREKLQDPGNVVLVSTVSAWEMEIKRALGKLRAPADLERICKGLAALDTMLQDDWEYRYYSFDKAWNTKRKERMASMRNGSGDEWFIVFSPSGVFVKAFWHEYETEDADVIFEGLPAKLAQNRKEPAFWADGDDALTFGGFHDGKKWTLRGNAKPMKDDLAILTGEAKHYRAYAKQVHEIDVPLDAIDEVLGGKKPDAKLAARINSDCTFADLKDDLAEIY